jgi:hypothetical protein
MSWVLLPLQQQAPLVDEVCRSRELVNSAIVHSAAERLAASATPAQQRRDNSEGDTRSPTVTKVGQPRSTLL